MVNEAVPETDVAIVGGGPAGVVLALQLARLGTRVTLLEKAASYQRSFRGESMQPDTVAIFHELGIADRLRRHGYCETHRLQVVERGRTLLNIDYSTKPYPHKYVLDVPQPVLLEALLEKIEAYANCTVVRGANVVALIEETRRIRGVVYQHAGSKRSLRCRWVVGADGRFSPTRAMSGLPSLKLPMQRDFLWFKVPVPGGWPTSTATIHLAGPNHLVLLPTYKDLYRAGVNIPKGALATVKAGGIEAFHRLIGQIHPAMAAHVQEHVRDWGDIHMLEIFTLTMPAWWRDGLLLIGDAAHTVTPMLGQGVNLAIEDAMVLAPLMAGAAPSTPDAELFGAFQAARQPDVDFVVKMQTRQEKLLCAQSPLLRLTRRLNYAIINRSGLIQSRLMDRLAYKRQRLALSTAAP